MTYKGQNDTAASGTACPAALVQDYLTCWAPSQSNTPAQSVIISDFIVNIFICLCKLPCFITNLFIILTVDVDCKITHGSHAATGKIWGATHLDLSAVFGGRLRATPPPQLSSHAPLPDRLPGKQRSPIQVKTEGRCALSRSRVTTS